MKHAQAAALLPKVFIGGCHLLQQVGDVIGHIRHLGTLTAVTDALEVLLRSNQKTLTQQHGEAGGHGTRTRRREPDTRWLQIKIDVTESVSGLWRHRVVTRLGPKTSRAAPEKPLMIKPEYLYSKVLIFYFGGCLK